MNAMEFFTVVFGIPVLIGVVYYCFEYGHFKFLMTVMCVLVAAVSAYFSLARYDVHEMPEGIIIRQNADFLHSREQIGDSLKTITICNYINSYEKDVLYQPRERVRILYLKNGHQSVFSKRRCLVSDASSVQFVPFKDSEGYTVDLLQYVSATGDTILLDTYNNRTVQLENFQIPAYYIDPSVYLNE